MPTLQERFADGEFEQPIKSPEQQAAEIHARETQRLEKQKWLEEPITKIVLQDFENARNYLLDEAMRISAQKNSSDVVYQLISRADAVNTMINKLVNT